MSPDFTARLQAALGTAYSVERELGGGGMSRVYLARETALGREVVLKVLPPELTSSVNLERFRREIQYAAQLQHPHIVPLLSAGESGDLLWYTMPLIPGESLRSVLERRGGLPPGEVIQILHDVADALGTAHALGLVHRDIKPENILIQGEHALVTDFGVAKAISASLPGATATAVGVAVGTPAYMAPEQVAGDPAGDHRIDLYALGLLAYELLTGTPAFRGDSPHQTMAAHLIRQPTPPDAMLADLPPGLSMLVMRCLQKDPKQRYPDAAAFLQDLRRISAGEGGRLVRGAAAQPSPTGLRRPGSLVMATAAISVLLTAGYFLLGPGETLAPEPPVRDTTPATPSVEVSAPTAALTLTDSLAIAAAVERELALQSAAAASITRSMLDSIRREITATVTDSIRRASRASGLSRPGPAGDPQQMGQLLELAGRPRSGPDARGEAAVSRLGSETVSRIMVIPSVAGQASGWFSLNQRDLAERVGAALVADSGLQVVSTAGRPDSLLAQGLPPEVVARFTRARFYLTMDAVRQRDSSGVTVTIHDLEPGSRQVRTLHIPFQSSSRPPGSLVETIATQVTAAVADMQGAAPRRDFGRGRDFAPPPRRDTIKP